MHLCIFQGFVFVFYCRGEVYCALVFTAHPGWLLGFYLISTLFVPASPPSFCRHSPEIDTQHPRCLFCIKWRISQPQEWMEEEGKDRRGRWEKEGTEKAQIKVSCEEEWRNIFKIVLLGFDVGERTEALCFTFLQRLYLYACTFGRAEITMLVSHCFVFCLAKWELKKKKKSC